MLTSSYKSGFFFPFTFLCLRLGPSRAAEHPEETSPLSQEVTGLTAGFCSLRHKVLAKQGIFTHNNRVEMTIPAFLARGLPQQQPQCWENQYLHFPTCLDLLKYRRTQTRSRHLMQTGLSRQNTSRS